MGKNPRDDRNSYAKILKRRFLFSFGCFLVMCFLLSGETERLEQRYTLNFSVMFLAGCMSIYYFIKLVAEYVGRK